MHPAFMQSFLKSSATSESPSPSSVIEIAPQGGEISLIQVWTVIRKRKWMIASCLGIALVLAAVYSIKATRRYEATARVVINPENTTSLGIAGDEGNRSVDQALMQETQVRIMQSDTVAWDVIRQLRLDKNPEFLSLKASELRESPTEITPDRRFELMTEFHRRLSVSSVPKTAMIELRFRSRNPKLSADIVTATANAYLECNFRTHHNSNLQVSEWLTGELDALKKKVEESQQRIVEFQKNTGIIGTDETHNIVLSQLDELNKHLAASQAERIVREARYRESLTVKPDVFADTEPSATLQLLRGQRADLNAQYVELSTKYGDAYPRVEQMRTRLSELDSSIEQEAAQIKAQVKTEYETAVEAENMAQDEVERTKEEAYAMNEAGIEYLILKREGDARRSLYEDLTRKLNEAGITAGLKSTNVAVVDPAEVPTIPAEPRILLDLLVSFLLGSGGGIGLAFLLESLDTTISSPEQVERLARMPVLGVVPQARVRKFRDGKAIENPERIKPLSFLRAQSSFAESFRALRTTLLLADVSCHPKVIVVTSSVQREGKTVTAINLASTLAQSQRRVLLVDANLRGSGMQERLEMKTSEGLTGCLTTDADYESLLVSIPELPTLDILPAGARPKSPTELLWSEKMSVHIEKWRAKYDHIIIDTPPVLGATDAVILATMSDAVLVVARCSQTKQQALCRARDLLSRIKGRMVGVVANDLDVNSSAHYSYYGYYGDVRTGPEPKRHWKPNA